MNDIANVTATSSKLKARICDETRERLNVIRCEGTIGFGDSNNLDIEVYLPNPFMKCPICGKSTTWQDDPMGPFCSERCKLIDFGNWIDEGYRVPGPERPSEQFDKSANPDRVSDSHTDPASE